ncbi:hypothetical protein SCHPADRAFT_841783 [Schizopora paradoxa]|uniref:C2 domain-containing protein n=1 Tax=Schizopora paradoxa TaxID=27342 RepID=A0A0H2SU20_9AGAM|nr:hypothetical protein SCHPADRAFT_841783 [Schizopora paradoxa]
MAESHKIHEGYSSKKPVPKVALKSILDPSGATEAKAKHIFKDRKHEDDDGQDEIASNAKDMVKGKEVRVTDPVTGEETTIKHGGDGDSDSNKGENILSIDYPPPDWDAHRAVVVDFTKSSIVKITLAYIGSAVIFHLVASLPLPSPFTPPLSERYPQIVSQAWLLASLITPSVLAYVLLFALRNKSQEDFENRVWDSERTRGLRAGNDLDGDGDIGVDERIQESAEWLNSVISGVWSIINTDLFNSSIDLLEDVMQASIPKFVHSVRIADLGQGSTPLRVTSIRSLPDSKLDDALAGADESVKEHLEREHVNVEVSFSYRARPSGSTAGSKAHNAHLLIDFYLGMKGVWEFSVPVWVELTGVAGTARARLELIPDPPFIKTTLCTFMGLPRISISVVPMSRALPNVMNLPVISTFIAKSIDAAFAEYVAPKSLSLDLQQLICGDDIKKDTEAIGVIVIHIIRAFGIKKMDSTQSSGAESADPYVTVAYTRQAKPLYSTRIIFNDLNPVFEETTAITLDANAIKVREKLSLQLWDSDRTSADDMMGFVEIDVLDLMRNKNEPTRRITPLSSPDSDGRPGSLEYTVGFYEKMAPNEKLSTDGLDPAIPEDLKQHDPDFREARAVALNDLEAAVLVTPPDPQWPSGILSVQVHEIRDLKVATQGREKSVIRSSRSEGEKGQDEGGEEQEEGEHLPSSYCTIAINDNLIYSTRVKPITASPTFNAGTERFIRDWRSTHVSVVVRDSRMRENDPILGIIFLKLSDILVNASEVTRFFPLEHGIGYGSARVSVLFRPVRASLPLNLLGFDSGMLRVRKVEVDGGEEHISQLRKCKVSLSTSSDSDAFSKKDARDGSDGIEWVEEQPLELEVHERYSKALTIVFKSTGLVSEKKAIAVLWLQDVVDNEEKVVDVPLWKTDDYDRLKQNYVPLDGKLDMWENGKENMTRIGTLHLDLTFSPGINNAHGNAHDSAKKRVQDEVDRREAAGLGDKVGEHAGEDGIAAREDNTEVSKEDTEIEEVEEHSSPGTYSDQSSPESGGENEGEGKGLLGKIRKKKRHATELNRQHKGVMQIKPARTAEWLKDNVEEAGHKVKDRFKMQARQPDVETEV